MIIYKTTNLINNKSYIGQDSHNNPNYLGSGVYLNRSIKKYGKEKFVKEIVAYCDTKDTLDFLEKFYIKFFDSRNPEKGYNLMDGGEGGDTMSGKKATKGQLRGLTFGRGSGKNNGNYKKKHPGIYNVGKNNPAKRPEVRKKIKQSMLKIWENEEYRKKLSNSQVIAQNRPEVKQKRSKSVTGENNPNYRHGNRCRKNI